METTVTQPQPMQELAERTITLADGRPGLRTALQISACSPPPSEEEGRGDVAPNSNSIPHSDPSCYQSHSALNTPNSALAQLRTPNSTGAEPVLDFIASSDTLDRYHEIIDAAGWCLDNYRRNPVFQNAHNYGDIIFTLGKALLTEVRDVGGRQVLFQRIQFATDVNPMARIAHGLYRGGFLSAVSVGFIPLRWENGTPETNFRRKYLEQELLEVSAVGIPANPDALALGLKSGAVAQSDLRELADLCSRSLQAAPGSGPNTNCIPHSEFRTPHSVALLSLARALREILRRS